MNKSEREQIKDNFQAATSKVWELIYSQQEVIFELKLEIEELRKQQNKPSDPAEKPFIYLSKGSKNWNVQFDAEYIGDVTRVTVDIGTSGSVTIDADGQRYWIDMANNQVTRPQDE